MASKRPYSSVVEADEPETQVKHHGGHHPEPADSDTDKVEAGTRAGEPTQLATPGGMGDLVDPDGMQGSRFSGPVLSGPVDGAGLPGIALLHKRAKILFSHGSFNVPVLFPPSSIVTELVVQIQQSYNGLTPKLNLGTTPNGVDVATVDLSVPPTQVFNNLQTILGSNWTLYLSQAVGAGNTAGKCTALIYYSVPAKTVYS